MLKVYASLMWSNINVNSCSVIVNIWSGVWTVYGRKCVPKCSQMKLVDVVCVSSYWHLFSYSWTPQLWKHPIQQLSRLQLLLLLQQVRLNFGLDLINIISSSIALFWRRHCDCSFRQPLYERQAFELDVFILTSSMLYIVSYNKMNSIISYSELFRIMRCCTLRNNHNYVRGMKSYLRHGDKIIRIVVLTLHTPHTFTDYLPHLTVRALCCIHEWKIPAGWRKEQVLPVTRKMGPRVLFLIDGQCNCSWLNWKCSLRIWLQ
jgi:hypothetical protein